MTRAAVLLALLLGSAAPLAAQEAAAPEPILPQDRVMAVVGEEILLVSEWTEQTLAIAQQLGVAPGTADFRRLGTETFQQLLDDLVVVAAAERDTSVKLSEEEVLEAVDREIAEIRRRFPSEDEFQRQLAASQWGSLAAYRADLQTRKRKELLGQLYIDVHRAEIQPVAVSEDEIRAVWEESREQIGTTPRLVRFEEIPVSVKPSDAARDSARTEAQRIKDEILSGQVSFGDAASRYSADESNREEGGDLGWFGKDRMVAAFEAAAFAAMLGEVVGPVETPFGMHVIQVVDRRAEEVRARHVLVAYTFTSADRDRARLEAEALRDLVAAGADVDSLQAAVMEGDSAAAAVIEIPPDRLPQAYATAVGGLAEGAAAVVETATGFSVVVSRGEAGGEPLTYEDVAPRIRAQLSQSKAEEAFVQRLRQQIYVDVRVRPEEVLGAAG